MSFVRGGGGLLGIHAASDSYGCGDYAKFLGGSFRSHPGNERTTICRPQGSHPAVSALPSEFKVLDEIYTFHHPQSDNQVVLTCDSVDGQEKLPIAWFKPWDRGRVFYTALGHTRETWQDKQFLQNHIKPAINWVLWQTN